jgi:hypothetical protein
LLQNYHHPQLVIVEFDRRRLPELIMVVVQRQGPAALLSLGEGTLGMDFDV